MVAKIGTESRKYVDLVWKTLSSWYEKFAEFTPNLVVGLVVFAFFLITSSYLSKLAVKLFHRFFPEKQETIVSLIGVFRFIILLLGTFISLEIMGLSGFLWKFIGSLGVAGVIAGVALKDLVSSIFSGLLVGIDKSFKVGDYITLANYSGNVQEIGFLTTKLITDDGKKVYIPNQVIFNAPFFNITASPQRKIILDFEIPVGEDIAKAKDSVLDEIQHLSHVDKTDAAEVTFTNVKQGLLTMQVKFWLEVGASINAVRSDAILKINDRLVKDGINLVTPTSINIHQN